MASLTSVDLNTPRNSHKNLIDTAIPLKSIGSMMNASTNALDLRVDRSGVVRFVGQIQASAPGVAVNDVIFTLPGFLRPLEPEGTVPWLLGVLLDVPGPTVTPFPVFLVYVSSTDEVECRAQATASANGSLQFDGMSFIPRSIF